MGFFTKDAPNKGIGIYSVYDAPAASYGRLLEFVTDAVAVRDFASAVADPQSILSKSPLDFTLMKLGFYDKQSGELVKLDAPMKIITASECVPRP